MSKNYCADSFRNIQNIAKHSPIQSENSDKIMEEILQELRTLNRKIDFIFGDNALINGKMVDIKEKL